MPIGSTGLDRSMATTRAQRRVNNLSQAYLNWSTVWNMLPKAARMREASPLVYFGGADLPGALGTTYMQGERPEPGAGYMGRPYQGPTVHFSHSARDYANLNRYPILADVLLHEAAHTAQTANLNPVQGQDPWEQAWAKIALVEGGADAWTIANRKRARALLGIPPGTKPLPVWGIPSTPNYRGYNPRLPFRYGTPIGTAPHTLGNTLLDALGRDWAQRLQFLAGPADVQTAMAGLLRYAAERGDPIADVRALVGKGPWHRR